MFLLSSFCSVLCNAGGSGVCARARMCDLYIVSLAHNNNHDFNIIANYFKIITVMCFLRK